VQSLLAVVKDMKTSILGLYGPVSSSTLNIGSLASI
jgi:hypothetical protein